MIHDATVDVTCDRLGCNQSVIVELEYVYSDYSGDHGYYNSLDSAIEKQLVRDHNWIIKDLKHFCCEECVEG